MNSKRKIIYCFLMTVSLLFDVISVTAGNVNKSIYKGWNSIALSNDIIEVQVVPEIGGRVIQFKLKDFEYLWVNDKLSGMLPPQSGVGPNGEWLNYGGDKIWPAPQGWERDDQWPGPPDPVLDGGIYTGILLVGRGNPIEIKLTSPEDKRSGIQFSRTIKVFDNSSRVSFSTTMTNIDTRSRRWGIWQVTQHNTANRTGSGYNENIRAYCPLNLYSIYPRGYSVMFGLADNPSFISDPENKMLRVSYKRLVGKVGIDCSAGWLAVVDGTNGYVFVERFAYFPDKKYPDNASVEFWTNGVGSFFTGKKYNEFKDDPIETPFLMESEVLSPFAELLPGEHYSFHLDWYAARIGDNLPVLGCSDVGVICEPLIARILNGKVLLWGKFGVFYSGKVGMIYYNPSGEEITKIQPNRIISPDQPLILSGDSTLSGNSIPASAASVELYIMDDYNRILGKLASAQFE